MAQKNNTDRIETWQGRSQVEVIYEDSNGVMIREKSVFDFAFSRQQDATRWKWTGQERYVREGLTIEGHPVSYTWGHNWAIEMRKGDSFYKYAPSYTTKEGQRCNTLVIWPARKAREGVYSYSFDPMWYLKGRITTDQDDLAEMLMTFYRRANNPKFAPGGRLKVKRDGNLVVFETGFEDVVNRHEFDLSKGGSVAKYYGESKTVTELREWTYEQKDVVWVPKTFTLESKWNSPQPTGLIKLIWKVSFDENALNRPIPPSEFSLKKLGLKYGEHISDKRTGRFYIYNEKDQERILQDLQPSPRGTAEDEPPPEFMESLVGKPLPELTSFGLKIVPEQIKGKAILVCFWDMNQRPSRNCIRELAKRAEQLKQKGVTIVAVQASKIDDNKINEWVKENNIPFSVGMIKGDVEKTRFDWGVQSLPWLILTDKEHIVRGEGFSLEELNEKIKQASDSER